MDQPTASFQYVNVDAGEPFRHPAIQHLLDLFAYDHLPEGLLRNTSRQCAVLAYDMADSLDGAPTPNVVALLPDPELETGLRKLLEAKDCFVRQALIVGRRREAAAEAKAAQDEYMARWADAGKTP